MSPTEAGPAPDDRALSRREVAVRSVLSLLVFGFAAFWIWALFFASKEAVNRIDDRGWADRAEQICRVANDARLELSDYRTIDDGDIDLIRERADIIDRATDIIAAMLNDVVAVTPIDDKGNFISNYSLEGAQRSWVNQLTFGLFDQPRPPEFDNRPEEGSF